MSNLQFTIDAKQFKKALNTVKPATNSRTHPILNKVLLDLSDGFGKITAFDLVKEINYFLYYQKQDDPRIDYQFCVDFKLLFDIINLSENDIVLTVKENAIDIENEYSSYTLPTIDKDEFPDSIAISGQKSSSFDFGLLKQPILEASQFASKDETKGVLTGIRLNLNETLTIAATDGHRLFVKTITEDVVTNLNLTLTLPAHVIKEIAEILKREDIIEFVLAGNKFMLQTDDICITSRVIDGVYPNYQALIPTEFKGNFEVTYNEINKVLIACNPLKDQAKLAVNVDISDTDLHVMINSELGNVDASCSVLQQGNELKFAANLQYFQEGIDCFKKEESIKINYNLANQPMIFEGNNTIYLMMPLQRR